MLLIAAILLLGIIGSASAIPAVDPNVEVIFTAEQWLGLFFWVILWYIHPFGFDWRYYVNSHYKRRVKRMAEKHKVKMIPLMWLGITWFVIYGFVGASIFIFWLNFPTTSALEIAIWSLIFANYFLNKGWGLLMGMPGAGFSIFLAIVLVAGSAVAVAVMGYIEKAYWLAGAFTGYGAFAIIYCYYAWYYWHADVAMRKEEEKERKAREGSGTSEAGRLLSRRA